MLIVMGFSSMWMAVSVKHRQKRAELLSQCHYVHHKSEMEWPPIEPGTREEKLTCKIYKDATRTAQ